MVHLVVGPDGGAVAARRRAALVDVAAEEARAHVPARRGPPVVVDTDHGRVAIEERAVDARRDESEVLRGEVAYHAQRGEGAAGVALLVGAEHAVLRGAEAAVELER